MTPLLIACTIWVSAQDEPVQCQPQPEECPGVVAEVCGTDNITYVNNCFLVQEACKFPEKNIQAKSIGKCFPDQADPREGNQLRRCK